MGKQDLNARKPRGILGLLFLFRSSDKVGRKIPEYPRTGKPSQNAPDGVPDGKPKGSASQNIPEHPSTWASVPECPGWRGKANAPGCLANDPHKTGWHWQDVARMARNIWQSQNIQKSQKARRPENGTHSIKYN